jgi:hypothetical protein
MARLARTVIRRFANLGHFAKDYQRAFGELPSATLARGKR